MARRHRIIRRSSSYGRMLPDGTLEDDGGDGGILDFETLDDENLERVFQGDALRRSLDPSVPPQLHPASQLDAAAWHAMTLKAARGGACSSVRTCAAPSISRSNSSSVWPLVPGTSVYAKRSRLLLSSRTDTMSSTYRDPRSS